MNLINIIKVAIFGKTDYSLQRKMSRVYIPYFLKITCSLDKVLQLYDTFMHTNMHTVSSQHFICKTISNTAKSKLKKKMH